MLIPIALGYDIETFEIMHTSKKYRVLTPKIIRLPTECLMFSQNGTLYLGSIYDFPIDEDNTLKNDNPLFIQLVESKSYSIKIKNLAINRSTMQLLVDLFIVNKLMYTTLKQMFGSFGEQAIINISNDDRHYCFDFSMHRKISKYSVVSLILHISVKVHTAVHVLSDRVFDYDIITLEESEYHKAYNIIMEQFPILRSILVIQKIAQP